MTTSGQLVSHYKILDRLGAGGMGVVYRATDVKLDRLVALKFLPPHLTADERARARFVSEARAASALDHPNIGTIYEIDETPDTGLFIVMAYYAGESLASRLGRGRLPHVEAIDIAIQIGEGLARAHAHGIVHRDIKPSNVMLTAGGLVKILDFGLAKVDNVHLTDAGATLGTPSFMAPEQTLGAAVDHRCDVWALGVLLFNMLAGDLPFTGETVAATTRAIREAEPAALDAPPDMQVIVRKALSKAPSGRHPTMTALVRELRQLAAGPQPVTGDSWGVLGTSGEAGETEVTRLSRTASYAPHPSGELRQVTVVACELAGLDALADAVDAQQLRELLIAFRHACAAVVRPLDGHLDHHGEADVRIHFGYPQAHEDDAHRAVSAGLALAAETQRLGAELSAAVPPLLQQPLDIRIGVHTGQVVAGDTALSASPGIVGSAGLLAARARAAADRNQVIITEATYRLVRGFFNVRPLAPRVTLSSAPVPLYHVVGRTTAESRIEAAADIGLTQLVGRTRELGLLLDSWHEVTSGAGRSILLTAEPGVGKSRLVQALKEELVAAPHARLECRCSPHHQNSPLAPLIELLGRIAHLAPGSRPEEKADRLRQRLLQFGLQSPDHLDALAFLLGLPLAPDHALTRLSGPRQRERIFAALLRLLLTLSAEHPVLLIVEDLHWVDPTTVEFLSLVIDQGPTARILTVLTSRPVSSSAWAQRADLHHVSLSRLSRLESEKMVAHLVQGKRLPDEALAHIVGSADGVPLFIEELTKALLDSGVLHETSDGFELKAPISSVAIPTTLAGSLMARLDRLGSAKDVAQLAAVFGRTFSYAWLEAVSPLGPGLLREGLSRLVSSDILYQRGLPPDATYTFKHALIRDAAYGAMLAATRRQFHARIARAFEEGFPDVQEREPELLAHHFTDAELPDQAATYWQRSGRRAVQRSAHKEAAAHFGRGLELLRALPDTAERHQLRLDLAIALGGARVALMGYAAPAVGEAYQQAHELCAEAGDSTSLFDALQGLWAFHVVRAELRTGLGLADRLVDLARRLDDRPRSLDAALRRGVSLYTLGQLADARNLMEAVRDQSAPDEPRATALLFGQHRLVACLSHLAWVQWLLGDSHRAVATSEEALARAREYGHPFSQAFALLYSAMLHSLRGEPSLVRAQAAQLAALCHEQAFAYRLEQSQILAGWTEAVAAGTADSLDRMEQAIERTRATGAQVLRPYYLMLLADACLRLGRVERGLLAVDEGMTLVERTEERLFEVELHRLRGELLARAPGDTRASAVASGRQALALAGAQGARSLALRAAISLRQLSDDRETRQTLAALRDELAGDGEPAELETATRLLPPGE